MFVGELKVSVARLKGVGPAAIRDLDKLGISCVGQLLEHLPRDYINRRDETTIRAALTSATTCNTVVQVVAHSHFGNRARPTLKLHVTDREGTVAELPCFNRPFLERSWPVGAWVWVYGTAEYQYGKLQLAQFELDLPPPGYQPGGPLGTQGGLTPIYPLAGTLTQAGLAKIVGQAWHDYVPETLDDEWPSDFQTRFQLLPLDKALRTLHRPSTVEELRSAQRTWIHRELFHLQTAVLKRPQSSSTHWRTPLTLPQGVRNHFLERLPFRLTPDQEAVVSEIDADLAADRPMARLLQGDVGSGKTLVAFLAVLPLIEAGYQCALMAPTELLALQHAENAAKLLDPLGVRVAFLSGNVKTAGRNLLLQALADRKLDLVVGTHALFGADVHYANLRCVIIDEQHRFGVAQRQSLTQKGTDTDLLLMSATPIPRTLALTAFGDLKTSSIRTMPAGRKSIVTHTNKMANQDKVYEFVRNELEAGRQAYFVYPLIEASEVLDVKDAVSMADELQSRFSGFSVGLIHSRLDDEEKRAVMEEFSRGRLSVLVATSVVEVGVDVANATCMVIEHAERFGLSALHQLRGRVGRSDLQSYCFLVYGEGLTDDAKTRIRVMMETTDGFRIAEEDLKLRGPGDMTGIKQSGFLKLKAADLTRDFEIMLACRDYVKTLLRSDPGWLQPQNAVLRYFWSKAAPFTDELVAT